MFRRVVLLLMECLLSFLKFGPRDLNFSSRSGEVGARGFCEIFVRLRYKEAGVSTLSVTSLEAGESLSAQVLRLEESSTRFYNSFVGRVVAVGVSVVLRESVGLADLEDPLSGVAQWYIHY